MMEEQHGFAEFLQRTLRGKKVLILGYGREGQSSWQTLSAILPGKNLGVADFKHHAVMDSLPTWARLHTGPDYLANAGEYEICLCSPGIPHHQMAILPKDLEISSQTDLFLRYFHQRCIGITGTKGKSTTSTLIRDMLAFSNIPVQLAGNIGIPPFEAARKNSSEKEMFVLELSAHQLHGIRRAPHIACILNLFEEHLDHFTSLDEYYEAKWNIGLLQGGEDRLLLNGQDQSTLKLITKLPVKSRVEYFCGSALEGNAAEDFRQVFLSAPGWNLDLDPGHAPAFRGIHQRKNAVAAAMMAWYAGAGRNGVEQALAAFRGLPHRLEYLGLFRGIHYYNDAIATIPEAVIEAIKTLGSADTLILGGMDRGINYLGLVSFLCDSPPGMIILSGPAGQRIARLLRSAGYLGEMQWHSSFSDAVEAAMANTPEGGVVLLSPAAPSYDEFNSFMEKGDFLRKKIGDTH